MKFATLLSKVFVIVVWITFLFLIQGCYSFSTITIPHHMGKYYQSLSEDILKKRTLARQYTSRIVPHAFYNVSTGTSYFYPMASQTSNIKAEFTGGDGVTYVCDVLNGQYENCMPKPSADANSRVTYAWKSSSQKAEFTSGDGVIYVCDVINGEYENCMPKTANAAPTPQPPAPATVAVAPTTSNKAEIIDDKGNAYQCDLIQGQYKNCVLTKKPDKIEYKNEKDERGNQYKCKYINGVKADCELTKKAKPKVEYKTETDERGNQYKCKYTDGEKGECTLTKKAKVKFEKMKDPDGNEYKCEVWNGNYENCVLTKAAPKKYVNIKDGNGVEYKCEEYRGQFINCEPVTNKSKHRSNKKK